MPLINLARGICTMREAALGQSTGPASQTHGATELVDALQLAQLEDDAVLRAGIELRGVRVFEPADVARVFNDQGLHAQADAEVGHLALARETDRVQHAVN